MTYCTQTLIALIYPFEWHHICIPVLPEIFLPFLDTTDPFIIGVHRSRSDQVLREKVCSLFFFDLDQNQVHQSIQIPTLPLRKVRKLTRHIRALLYPEVLHLDTVALPIHSKSNQPPPDFFSPPPITLGDTFEFSLHTHSPEEGDRLIRVLFLKFFVSILGKYRDYILPNSQFDINKYLSSRPQDLNDFLKLFVTTYAFANLLQSSESKYFLHLFNSVVSGELSFSKLNEKPPSATLYISLPSPISGFRLVKSRKPFDSSNIMFFSSSTDQLPYELIKDTLDKIISCHPNLSQLYLFRGSIYVRQQKYVLGLKDLTVYSNLEHGEQSPFIDDSMLLVLFREVSHDDFKPFLNMTGFVPASIKKYLENGFPERDNDNKSRSLLSLYPLQQFPSFSEVTPIFKFFNRSVFLSFQGNYVNKESFKEKVFAAGLVIDLSLAGKLFDVLFAFKYANHTTQKSIRTDFVINFFSSVLKLYAVENKELAEEMGFAKDEVLLLSISNVFNFTSQPCIILFTSDKIIIRVAGEKSLGKKSSYQWKKISSIEGVNFNLVFKKYFWMGILTSNHHQLKTNLFRFSSFNKREYCLMISRELLNGFLKFKKVWNINFFCDFINPNDFFFSMEIWIILFYRSKL